MHTTHELLPMASSPLQIRKFISHTSGERVHWHEEIEILYFVQGEGVISCNLQEHRVKAGDILLFNGNELHTGCLSGENTVYYCIHVNTAFFHNLIGEEYVIFGNVIQDDACATLLNSIIACAQKSGFSALVDLKHTAYAFFSVLCRKHVRAALNEENYKKQFRRLDTFNHVIAYINRHYGEDLSVQRLAERFFISTSYLAHLFTRRAGKSITVYINEVRVQAAKGLLEREMLSVGEIANRVGFDDGNYFSRKFKAVTGMKPTEYRHRFMKRICD